MIAAGWLLVTVAVYLAARALHARVPHPLLSPAIVAIAGTVALLLVTATPHATYEQGGRVLSALLGPAVVALGVPLAMQLGTVRRNARAVVAALAAGAAVGVVVAVGVALLLGASREVVVSLAPRSATTPIAVAITARLGGIPALSAVVSIVSGAIGGVVGVAALRAAGVTTPLATGLALGGAAHGLGTARAAGEGPAAAAYAGLAMGAVGVLTALIAPAVIVLLRWVTPARG